MDFPRPLKKNDVFYRAVNPCHHHKNDGTISSALFQNTSDDEDAMSVDWSEKSTPQQTLDRFPAWPPSKYVVPLTANDYWDACQEISYEPLCDNPAHTHVVGGKTRSIKRALAKKAQAARGSTPCKV